MSVLPLQSEGERKRVEAFLAARFAPGVVPPFSFMYSGKPSSQLLNKWQFSQETKQLDNVKTEHLFTYTDPHTGLQVCCNCEGFLDFPAVEWVVTFKNGGSNDTPVIEDVQALDANFTRTESGEFILHRAAGCGSGMMDYAPIDNRMPPGSRIRLAPLGGRSNNTNAFPFFNIEAQGEGVMVGIGWSGQWSAELLRDGGAALTVRAGMELTHLVLHPDEQIRTPRILLLFWQGDDRMRGHNMLRRFVLMHHTPQKGGEPVTMPFACAGGRIFDIANEATEENQIELASRFVQLGIMPEYFWIDAGWNEGFYPNGMGNWFVRKDAFPHGLRGVSDAVRKMGMGLIVWFEPERVCRGTWLDREHPDWILRVTDLSACLVSNPQNGLLNLGNPEALQWLTDHISKMIENDGISIYRQDCNIDPLPYWRGADEVDRQGMTEIRHIEGLYAHWDELLARHPGLMIDNVSSGARRVDLETITRGFSLTSSDCNLTNSNQCHTYGFHLYLPCIINHAPWEPGIYDFRGALGAGAAIGDWDPYTAGFPVERVQRLIGEFRRLRPFFYGDFYPLTPHGIGDDVWMAYQFHREDLGQGMFLAFRRLNNSDLTTRLTLRGLLPSGRYELDFEDTGVKQIFTGEVLAAGINITIEDAPGSLLVTYREFHQP